MSAEKLPVLSNEEVLRYSRHLMIPEVGIRGQRRLKNARVLLVGAGGLGSPTGLYLAAAGVGHLGLVEFDRVEESNLQRQIIHGTRDVGRLKLDSARDRLFDLNPQVELTGYPERLDSQNALRIIRDYDLVVDGTDNFATRYLINDACVLLGKANVYGSIFRFEGQASVFATEAGPCYRCLYPAPPPPGRVPSCADGGVLGVLPGLLGVIQATEAIKWIVGAGDSLVGRLLLVDALKMSFRTLNLRPDPACPVCGTREQRELVDYEQFCGLKAKEQGPVELPVPELTPRELAQRRACGDDFDLLDVREAPEWEIAQIPGARLTPLSGFATALRELDPGREFVVHCKGGDRSENAVRQLQAAGFKRVWNLTGGILRWSDDVDPRVPKY